MMHTNAPSTIPVELLLRPDSYPERPIEIQLIETDGSWVFLTDRYVYKLKKPIPCQCMDLGTPDGRYQACQQERTLNRRLAPDVYLDVLPIAAKRSGTLTVGGKGREVDWVVKMRRLPSSRALDALIRDKSLRSHEIDKLAAKLAAFYANAAPLTVLPQEYCGRIEQQIQCNRSELLQMAEPRWVRRLHGAQLQFLKLSAETLENRARDGRIIEGHGDLRPEHIYVLHEPVVIGCHTADRELRCLDALEEICALAIECRRLGAEAVARRVLDVYCEVSVDNPPDELTAFYQTVRACTQARLAGRPSPRTTAPTRTARVKEYLDLADQFTWALGPPLLIVVRGLTGSGKTTLAAELARSLSAELLQIAAVGRDVTGRGGHDATDARSQDDAAEADHVYDEALVRASRLLRDGMTVVLDGTFLTTQARQRAVTTATHSAALPLIVHCRCPDETAKARVAGRRCFDGSVIETGAERFQLQKSAEQPDPLGVQSASVDTTAGLAGQVQDILSVLSRIRADR